MMKWDEGKLRALTVHQRQDLWKNAKRLGAHELVALIESCGLPYSDTDCLRTEDPITLKMHEIIYSDKGKTAGAQATEEGLPAMIYIDPMLLEALGVDYGAHNMGTATAGSLVAEMMRTQGYKTTGKKGKLPPTCVAKSAEIFTRVK